MHLNFLNVCGKYAMLCSLHAKFKACLEKLQRNGISM